MSGPFIFKFDFIFLLCYSPFTRCDMMNNESLSKEKIILLLKEKAVLFDIHVLDCVTSTNDILKEMTLHGAKEGTVVIAKEQSAGKGRKGRSFYSPANSGLYMSILLRPSFAPRQAALLTPMTAIAVAESIEELTDKKIDIKWVNDLLLDGKKICGILTEASIVSDGSHMEYVIVGIGVNLSDPKNGFPLELSDVAGSLHADSSRLINEVTAHILQKFMYYYLSFNAEDFFENYKSHLFFLGKEIDVISRNMVESALALDIDDEFHLIVRIKNGEIRKLDSGEISIKPFI